MDIFTVFNFYISLIGVIGAFFYIHMGNWLQNLKKIEKKWDLTQNVYSDNRKEMLQAKYEIQIDIGEYNNNIFRNLLIIINGIFISLTILISILQFNVYLYNSGDINTFYFFWLPFVLFVFVFLITSIKIYIIGWKVIKKVSVTEKDLEK